MAVGFANAVHIALRLSAVAGAADLHATRQLLLPLHVVKDFTFRLPVSDESGQLFGGNRLAQGNAPQRGQALKIGVRLPSGVHSKFAHRHRNRRRGGLLEKLRVKRDVAAGARQPGFQLQQLRQPRWRQRIECRRVIGKNGNGAVSRFCQQRRVLLEELFGPLKWEVKIREDITLSQL